MHHIGRLAIAGAVLGTAKVAGAVVGGIAAYRLCPKIARWWKEKRIAVIGARTTGKTHLATFLVKGDVPAEFIQDALPIWLKRPIFKLQDLQLRVADILDTPGSTNFYPTWEHNCSEADIILYLVRANEVFAGNQDTMNRIRQDVKRIQSWLERRNPKPLFFVVGTFCDLDHRFKGLTKENFGNYHDEFAQQDIIKEISQLASRENGRAAVILGSMKDIIGTQRLVGDLLTQVTL